MHARTPALGFCLLLFLGSTLGSALGCAHRPGEPGPTKNEPSATTASGAVGLDADLSGFSYPYEVRFLPLQSQRQSLRLAYMDVAPAKESNGKTVLLLHGKNFSGAYWARTIEALRTRGYRVVVPDQVGFGKSSKPEHFQFTFQALATHTRLLLDALGVDRTFVVGHSMGGMLGTRFALMFPERTLGLALVNPIGLEDWKRVVPYRPVEAQYEAELKSTPDSILAYMRESYFDGQWKPEYEPLVALQAGWAVGPDRERMAWLAALTSDMVFTQPVVHEFEDLRIPTLLIIGQRDRTAIGKAWAPESVRQTLGDYPKLGRAAAAAISGARLVELPGVGHLPQVEAYDAYLQALLAFFEDAANGRLQP